jgi:hypothetical protein
LAQEAGISHIGATAPLQTGELVQVLSEMAQARSRLSEHETIKYISRDADVELTQCEPWSEEVIESLSVLERIQIPATPMILLVRRPDYIGNAQWEFRHGKMPPLFARITDDTWLAGFKSRKIDLRPGDALRCIVSGEVRYGFNYEVVGTRYIIEKVDGVIRNNEMQHNLFRSNDQPKY